VAKPLLPPQGEPLSTKLIAVARAFREHPDDQYHRLALHDEMEAAGIECPHVLRNFLLKRSIPELPQEKEELRRAIVEIAGSSLGILPEDCYRSELRSYRKNLLQETSDQVRRQIVETCPNYSSIYPEFNLQIQDIFASTKAAIVRSSLDQILQKYREENFSPLEEEKPLLNAYFRVCLLPDSVLQRDLRSYCDEIGSLVFPSVVPFAIDSLQKLISGGAVFQTLLDEFRKLLWKARFLKNDQPSTAEYHGMIDEIALQIFVPRIEELLVVAKNTNKSPHIRGDARTAATQLLVYLPEEQQTKFRKLIQQSL
jgi:hypothetical protein